ncbi:MAG: DUF3168 domain-containing protein [Pseudomonadota bacterium]
MTALVNANNIHGQSPPVKPTWPFIKTGQPTTIPRRAACLDGAIVTMPVHAFARSRFDGNQAEVETAEDHAGRIGEAIETALDAKGDTITGAQISYMLTDMTLMTDAGEPDAFHYFCTVRAKVTA